MIASFGHDVGHPGVTNRYLLAARDKLAYRYNDRSILENMHCAVIFELMQEDGYDVLVGHDDEEWQEARKIIITMVLETDMARHFDLFNKFRLKHGDMSMEDVDHRLEILSMGLKCADVAHCAKSQKKHIFWTNFLMQEFYA